jgi:type IV secretory pathway TraG/TraD family ATPase VirD4
MQMKNALLDWSGALKARALIYDGKREFYPLLIGMGISPQDIRVLLPTDRRSVPWDIAADVDTPEDTQTLAKSLAPGNEKGSSGNDDFFSRATQAILGGVLWSLHLSRPRRWDLYDVVEAMRSESSIDAVLSFNDQSRSIFKTYIGQPKQGSAVLSTLLNDIVLPFETTAALWKRSTRPGFSLKEWIKTPRSSVLLMMPDPTTTSVQPINRAMFHWAAQLLDSQPELSVLGPDHETWMFLDEFRFARELPLLDHLLAKGRSKGIHITLASQTIEGIVDVYGENRTFDMMSNAANLAVLRLAMSPSTEKVAKLFGQQEVWEEDFGQSKTKNYKNGLFNWWAESLSYSTSSNKKRTLKDVVLSSTLTDLPAANEKNGVHGIFRTPTIGTWKGPVPWSFVQKHLSEPSGDEAYSRRPVEDFLPIEKKRPPQKDEP